MKDVAPEAVALIPREVGDITGAMFRALPDMVTQQAGKVMRLEVRECADA